MLNIFRRRDADAIRSQLIHDLSQARRDREDAQAAYNNAQARRDTRAMNAAGRALKAATGRVMALELKVNR